MKTIDWRKVTQDKELAKEFAVTVHNRFHSLYPNIVLDSENLDESCTNLSKITEETKSKLQFFMTANNDKGELAANLPVFYVSKMYTDWYHKLVFYDKSPGQEIKVHFRALLALAGSEIMQGMAPNTDLERKLEKLTKKGAKTELGGA